MQANVTTPRVYPRKTTTTAPHEITPSPRVSNAPTFEEEHDNSLAYNKRSRKPTITQEYVLQMININQSSFTAQQAALWKYPKEDLSEVLNEETGELMEYRHLISDPKYRKICKPAYGKQVGRLSQGVPGIVDGTNTFIFIYKNEVPSDR